MKDHDARIKPKKNSDAFTPPSLRFDTTDTVTDFELDSQAESAFQLSPKRAGHSFSELSVLRPQAKLKVNNPGDSDEQEADRMSELVLQMEDKEITDRETIRKADEKVQRKGTGAASAGEAPDGVISATDGGGQPLDAATRTFMEPRFGFDFSRVRIHADAAAAHAAESVQAHAYTLGNNVVFGQGRYAPNTF
jgi:hypothetical protein